MSKSIAMFDIEIQLLNCLSGLTTLDKLITDALGRDSLSEEEKYDTILQIDKVVDRALSIYVLMEDDIPEDAHTKFEIEAPEEVSDDNQVN